MASNDHHKHFIGHIAQKALIERDGKILLVQYPEGDKEALKWDLPGGRLNEGESAIAGLEREVYEEIGAEIQVDGIIATGTNIVNEHFKLFFVIYKAHLLHPDRPLVPEAGEIGKIEWRDKADFFILPIIARGYQEALKGILL